MSSHKSTPSVDMLLQMYFPDAKTDTEKIELPQMQPEVVSGLGFRNDLQPGDIKISKTLQRLKRSESKENTLGPNTNERGPTTTTIKQRATNELKKPQKFTGKELRPRTSKSFQDRVLGKRV
ncbi:hypothetical protein GMRT_jh010 [Giardia muris]|uniref:Uncharacterized protein n=1 Tax=Giardia muris TaxID=5742 RepID=A0A4Z1SXH3_GIAMU|nr:hypothetical protein GMRT_jh010 [Giardia muris]|eukprot:TNJ30424.1 hypothetical protein GMRT_jh010 [Giardia muris]